MSNFTRLTKSVILRKTIVGLFLSRLFRKLYTGARNRFFSTRQSPRVVNTIQSSRIIYGYSPTQSDYFRYSRGNDGPREYRRQPRAHLPYVFIRPGRYDARTRRDLHAPLWSWQSPRHAGSDTARLYSLRSVKMALYGGRNAAVPRLPMRASRRVVGARCLSDVSDRFTTSRME